MRCPLNDFQTCLGDECEWYIKNEGYCAVALLAKSSKSLDEISLFVQAIKDDNRNPIFRS